MGKPLGSAPIYRRSDRKSPEEAGFNVWMAATDDQKVLPVAGAPGMREKKPRPFMKTSIGVAPRRRLCLIGTTTVSRFSQVLNVAVRTLETPHVLPGPP
jgi:hypothetical protein